jgi:hypothetical protein
MTAASFVTCTNTPVFASESARPATRPIDNPSARED